MMFLEDLSGPEFLAVYLWLLLGAMVAIGLLRLFPRGPKPLASIDQISLNPYEAAYLVHGPARAVESAVAALIHVGALKADGRRVSAAAYLTSDALPLESAVRKAVSEADEPTAHQVKRAVRPALDQMRRTLHARQFIVGSLHGVLLRAVPLAILLALAVFGIMRIDLGISRARPVGYLTLLVLLVFFLMVLAAAYLWGRGPIKTRRGSHAASTLKLLNDALRTEAGARPDDLSGRDVAWVVGLFGAAAVNDASIMAVLRPPQASSTGSSFASCGWGFTSCGGGGGCGGGGCGGGGCGG